MRLPFGLRWWELLPEAALGLGLGAFLLTEPDAAGSAFGSTTALRLMGITAGGWLVVRFAAAHLGGRWAPLRTAGFGAAALGVLAVVVLPAYDDRTVVETLPVEAADPTPPVVASPDPAATSSEAAPLPRVLAHAAIQGIDHRASGTARVYEQATGALLVGLEEIDIQPGPDYDLYLVPGAGREDLEGGVRLDDLRGNKGTQYYEVPSGTGFAPGAWTVLVWCQTFDVPIAGATPA